MALVQLVAQREIKGSWDPESFLENDEAWGWGRFDQELFQTLVLLVDQEWEVSSCITHKMISGDWEWKRMCPLLRSLTRCAITELSVGRIDVKIAVKEYAEIGSSFYDRTSRELSFLRSMINAFAAGKGRD